MTQIAAAVSPQPAAPHGIAYRAEPDVPAGTVRAALNFIVPQDTKPVFRSAALTGGKMEYDYAHEAHTVAIEDMRGIADTLSVDREGFELLPHETAVADLYDDEAIDRVYRAEIEALLRQRFGASKVAVFDVTRRSDNGTGAQNPDGKRGPATQVHVDYTVKSGPKRAKDVLGEAEVDRLLAAGARILQINVWRPIHGPVERSPLAVADASTVRAEELIATDQVFPDRVGEIYNLAYAPTQRWYTAPRMTEDEVLLLKSWDSLDDGRARFAPHGAFNPPQVRPDAPPRESIEVRTYVVVE